MFLLVNEDGTKQRLSLSDFKNYFLRPKIYIVKNNYAIITCTMYSRKLLNKAFPLCRGKVAIVEYSLIEHLIKG